MTPHEPRAPRLTVFTPFYDNVQYLHETIATVLNQSFSDFEYLLINDGDPAEARRIEERFADARLRIINTPSRLGVTESRNAALREARGELIAFIDSDDFCEAGRLEKQVRFLDEHPDHVLVGSAIRYVDEHSRTIGSRSYPQDDAEIKRRLVVVNCIAQPAVMARRQSLIDVGGYSPEFGPEDYDLWLRLARMGKFHNLPEQLVAYRIHLQSSKYVRLTPTLRDTLRLKIRAIRSYDFPITLLGLLSIAAHALLLLMPSRFVYWLFKRFVVLRRES